MLHVCQQLAFHLTFVLFFSAGIAGMYKVKNTPNYWDFTSTMSLVIGFGGILWGVVSLVQVW